MATVSLIEYEDASPAVRAVYDDIRAVRKTDYINNFWKALANQPETLARVWASLKEVMGAGELDPLTKEMLYIAVSIANNCDYCIHSHTASAFAKGMSARQYEELLAVVAMAHQTNALATALKVPVDEAYWVGGDVE
jgi:AhpD family alkylhydroperoxidase